MDKPMAAVLREASEGDSLRIESSGLVITGEVKNVNGDWRSPGPYSVTGESFKLTITMMPPEPDVGIRAPYPSDGGVPDVYVSGEERGKATSLKLL